MANLEYLGICLASETGEVCGEIKNYSRGTQDWVDTVGKLRGELPDILIYLVMLADALGINLEKAYDEKKEYNDRRYLEGV